MYFQYISPTGSLSQTEGTVGELITLFGNNFGNSQNTYNSSLYISGVYVTPLSWSDNAIKFRIPNFNSTGNKIITLKTSGKEVELANYTLRAPTITSSNVIKTGTKNTQTVTLLGNYFSNRENLNAISANGDLEYFGVATINLINWSDNHINFTWEGKDQISITIKVGNLNSNTITLTPP